MVRLAAPFSAGSIPACTGKPVKHVAQNAADEVYPRMYGETRRVSVGRGRCAGLSRGNLCVKMTHS